MDAACTIQDSIHVFSLVHKYVSRILGTYHLELWYFVAKENPLRINVILLWQLFSIPHSQLPGIFMEEIE